MNMTVKIAGRTGSGFRAWCPALPGCEVFALTREEARKRIALAVEGYLASFNVALPRELSREFGMEEMMDSGTRPFAPASTEGVI